MKKVAVTLKNGQKVLGDEFDENDFIKLKQIFGKWLDINLDLKSLGGRN